MENESRRGGPNTGLAIILMVALLVVYWWLFHAQFARLLIYIAFVFNWPFKTVAGIFTATPVHLDQWMRLALMPANLKTLTFGNVMTLFSEVGALYRIPVVVLMCFLAWRAWRHPILHLNKQRNLEDLIQYQSTIWKAIVPVVNRDLTNDFQPDWAPSRTASELAAAQKLVYARRLKLEEAWMMLEEQLGPRWGERVLLPHEKALFAVFAARICRQRKAAERLLDDLNESCRKNGLPDFELALPVYEQFKSEKRVLSAIKGFGYIRTVLFEMLVSARRFDGKLPTSHFLWLKPVDRTLWYSLDRAPVDAGRVQVAAFSEGLAVAGQWQAEWTARKSGYRMGKTFREKDGENVLEYVLEMPYLVNALVAFAIDLESCGVIDFPQDLTLRLAQESSNERKRFNLIRDRYVLDAKSPVNRLYDERVRVAKELAKQSKQRGNQNVAV